MSRATAFFALIKAGGAAFLHNLVKTKSQEADFLDFKGAGRLQDKAAKELWSQALSGFANTEGGVLVWGIRAARNAATGIDEADSLDLAPDVSVLAQMLRDVELQAVIDPVPGVQIERYVDSGTAGFVVCLIPEGPHKPYRAELCGKQYYQRIGDKFAVIPHSLLRSLFYPPTPRPKFRVTIEHSDIQNPTQSGGGRDPLAGNYIQIAIENIGRVSARDVWVVLRIDHSFRGQGGPLFTRIPLNKTDSGYLLSSRPLHPSERLMCASGLVEYPAPGSPGAGVFPGQVSYGVSVYATDCDPVTDRLVFADLYNFSTRTTEFSSPARP
jgi:hypothetical protein